MIFNFAQTLPKEINLSITVSDPVTDLNVTSEGPGLDPDNYSANVTVAWTIPCKSNGQIEWFLLEFSGTRKQQEIKFQRQVPPAGHDMKGRMSYTETDLQPEVEYTVKVAIKTSNVSTLSDSTKREWKSPSGCKYGWDLTYLPNRFDTQHI